jgi:tetratricopeptide (TPR) repeat protein
VQVESAPPSAPLNPQTWIDLLTVHTLQGDLFSARTLMVIQEGIEKLVEASQATDNPLVLTPVHTNLFERLQRSFNNPNLLKEVGAAYLGEFRMPGIALKHLELARQFAPKDRDIEQLQVAAALAVAKKMSDASGHSGLDEAASPKSEVSNELLRRTSSLANILDARGHLNETAGELGRKQEVWRRKGEVKKATTGAVPNFREPLGRIQASLDRADFPGAAAALAEAQQAGAPKEETQAYYAQLGLTAFDHGELKAALDAFLHMRVSSPDAIEGWFNCGLVYQKMGRLEEALASYQEAARVAPENPKPWCNLSAVWFDRGDYPEAERAARHSLELKADYARAWDNLASSLSAMNRLTEAADACQQAIRIQPALHSAWFKFGVVNFQLDDLMIALEAFNVTADNPDFASYVLYYTAMIHARRGELDEAVEKLEQARATDPDNDLEVTVVREIAAAFTKAGSHGVAAAYYRHIADRRPDDFSLWLALGTALHKAERLEEARAAYLRATELRPENPVPWHNLGMLASDQGNPQESRDYFQREVELAPDDAKAWYDLGVSLKNLGLEDESANAFSQAEGLVKSLARRSSDLSAALSIVRRLNLGERVLKTE